MSRRVWILSAPLVLVGTGCQSLGRLPGIDPTDYAYTFYKCDVTQVYPQTVPQLRSAALEAMKDLGYYDIHCSSKDGASIIRAYSVDGRPARVTIVPRNAMSAMTVKVGPIGDEVPAQALIQRVAMNFGSLPRTIIPMEPTLARRIDPQMPGATMLRPEAIPAPPADDGTIPLVPDGPGPFAPSGEADPKPGPAMKPARLRLREA